MQARIEIILGCMFSGKSSELITRCSRYKAIGKNILMINHANDTRTEDNVATHSRIEAPALKVSLLNDVFSQHKELYIHADIIGIDEAQFFGDLKSFLILCEQNQKTVIIAGLDGDFNRNPFGQILECIPMCDEVVKLKALDMVNNDGTEAIFTRRLVEGNETIMVGASDKYIAVSRNNYLI